MQTSKIGYFFLLCTLISSSLVAQTYLGEEEGLEYLLFDEIPSVMVASKKAEKISDAPGVITVVTSDEIKNFGSVTFWDILQRLGNIQPMGSHLFRDNVVVARGALFNHYENHVLFLIDGRPFRDGSGGGYNATLYQGFPVEMIDRLEIIRGPGSVLYGSNAFDAVINIITKTPGAGTTMSVMGGGGSYGATLGQTMFGYAGDQLKIIANVNYYDDDGWDYESFTAHPALGVQQSSIEYGQEFLTETIGLQYKNFTLNAFHSELDRTIVGIIPAWLVTGGQGDLLNMEYEFIDLGYSQLLGTNHELKTNLTYNRSFFELTGSLEAAISYLGEISLSGSLTETLNYLVGVTVEKPERDQENDELQKIVDYDLTNWSAYAQVDYRPSEKLKLFFGLQHNSPEDISSVTVPRIGGIYYFTPDSGLKVFYSEAFRAAGPIETLVYYPGVILGNQDLEPEIVKTVDCQLFYNNSTLQSSLTVFTSKYEDLVARVIHPTFVPATTTFVNSDELETFGVELEAKIKFTDHLYATLFGSWKEEKDDKLLTPDYMIKCGVSYTPMQGLQFGLFDSFFGEAQKNSGTRLNPEADGAHIVTLNCSFQPTSLPNLTFNVWVRNLFEEEYYFPEFSKGWVNTLPLELDRSVYGKVTLKF